MVGMERTIPNDGTIVITHGDDTYRISSWPAPIPVSERLPTREEHGVYVLSWSKPGAWDRVSVETVRSNPTYFKHWLPLPPKPE